MKTADFITVHLAESILVAAKLQEQVDSLSKIIDFLYDAWLNRKQVFIMGNGGSASTATHFASDLAKTIISDPLQIGIKAHALSDNVPLVSALTNDWGWENLYLNQLRTFAEPGDVAIGFSVHGGAGTDKAGAWSQNLLRALQFAKDKKLTTIGFSGYDGGPMKDLVDTCVVVPANSTPHVEAFHVVLTHLITFGLKQKIDQESKIMAKAKAIKNGSTKVGKK